MVKRGAFWGGTTRFREGMGSGWRFATCVAYTKVQFGIACLHGLQPTRSHTPMWIFRWRRPGPVRFLFPPPQTLSCLMWCGVDCVCMSIIIDMTLGYHPSICTLIVRAPTTPPQTASATDFTRRTQSRSLTHIQLFVGLCVRPQNSFSLTTITQHIQLYIYMLYTFTSYKHILSKELYVPPSHSQTFHLQPHIIFYRAPPFERYCVLSLSNRVRQEVGHAHTRTHIRTHINFREGQCTARA